MWGQPHAGRALAPVRRRTASGIVPAMAQISTTDLDLGFERASRGGEDARILEWREEQLRRLGLLPVLARAFADCVDWHDVASLVQRGCPPMLAIEIVR
jgi:hypothetical protein